MREQGVRGEVGGPVVTGRRLAVCTAVVLCVTGLLGATARLLLRRGTDRRALLREVRGLVAEDARRRRLNRKPVYVSPDGSVDAGETEVDERSPAAVR